MHQCKKCKEIKFSFQFTRLYFGSCGGNYSKLSNLCKKCAKEIAESAIYVEQQRLLNGKNNDNM